MARKVSFVRGSDTSAGTLHTLAEAVAAENLEAANIADVGIPAAREALVHGFDWVTLYAAVCAWALMLLSFLAFGCRRTASVATERA